jgi:DNA-binding NtrC family response regulator
MPAARNLAVVHYSRLGIRACKSEWNDARLLVVVCSRENTGADDVPTAVSLADDFVYCSTAPAELNLRIDRLLQPTRARSGGGDREKAMLRRALLNESEILGAADIELPKARSRELLARETLRRAKSLVIGDFERGYLSKLLAEHNGNISQAARAAGKDRRTLQRLVRKYSLKRESFKL